MPAAKRSAPSQESTGTRRRSGRLSSTQLKSVYFESSNEDESEEQVAGRKKRATLTQKRGRKAANESDEEEQFKEDSEQEAEVQPKKRPRGRPPKKAKEESDEDQYHTPNEDKDDKDNNDDDEDNNDDDDDDDDGPRKVEIIPLEKLRDTGGVPYEDHYVHKNTMLFLKDLKANNKRPWLKSHDGEYRRALKDWQSFVDVTTQTLIKVDDTIPELPAKDVVFRIHRDIRFSKDPTPYKAHFSAAWSRTGKKGPYAVYYVHCEPKATFIGGGLWHPEAVYIAKLRQSIDERPRRWRWAFSDPHLRKVFFPAVEEKDGVEAVVKAFVARNQENALKKRPMGYEVTHRDIELLKLRNFTVGTKIDDNVMSSDDAQAKIKETMMGLSNFITFLNSVVMPDPDIDDEEESDEEDGEDDEEVPSDDEARDEEEEEEEENE